MPRPPRIYLEKCLYYITSISSYEGFGLSLFYDREDYRNYLDLMARYRKEFGFKLFGFALLPNRLHLLVELKNGVTISTIMHALNSTYTKIYNNRYGKKGHLFQERFRAVLVDKESYLQRLSAHIHACPVRLGLAKEPSQYPHTSYACYLGGSVGSLNLRDEVGELLEGLPGTDKTGEYAKYCASFGGRNKETENFEKLIGRKHVIGSQAFLARVKEATAKGAPQEAPAGVRAPVRRIPAFAASLAVMAVGVTAAAALFLTGQQAVPVGDGGAVTKAEPAIVAPRGDKPQINVQVVYKNRLESYDLDGSIWDIELVEMHTNPNAPQTVVRDRLKFKNRVLASSALSSNGFSPTRYTIKKRSPDVAVWQTVQQKQDGSMARWYGEWDGKTLKGFMTQHAAEGVSREFSFTGVRIQG